VFPINTQINKGERHKKSIKSNQQGAETAKWALKIVSSDAKLDAAPRQHIAGQYSNIASALG